MQETPARTLWQIVLRIVIGIYWIYFSLMKWVDRSWVSDLLNTAAAGNYIPGYGSLLKYIATNNIETIAITMTVIETVVGAFILLGILTRVAGAIGAFLDVNLMLTFAFCRCPWTQDFPLIFWFYFFPIILNVQVIFDNSSSTFGLQRILGKLHLPPKSQQKEADRAQHLGPDSDEC